MKQRSLAENAYAHPRGKRHTRKQIFLTQMNAVIPWVQLLALIEEHMPQSGPKGGRPPFAAQVMLRIHFMQQWFGLGDAAMEEALYDVPLYRSFAGLDLGQDKLPDESTILRFRHLIERHGIAPQLLQAVNTELQDKGLLLRSGSVVDATLIAAPSSTKNQDGQRDPQMHSTKKGNNYHFGMKAHIGVDAQSGLVHTVTTTAANAHDITQASALLHGQEHEAFGDAGYQGVQDRAEVHSRHPDVTWHTAMKPSAKKALMQELPEHAGVIAALEKLKAGIRAKVEHPFQVIKCQWGYRKTRYRGLYKNTQQIITLFALHNLFKVRRHLMPSAAPRPCCVQS